MNALTRDLEKLTAMVEKHAVANDIYREQFHLMPPTGWLNDPNGLCQFHGVYHAFFQYSPFDAEGGLKLWGHYTSTNMIDWEYQGVSLYADQPYDCHGVYSGSAFVENDTMYLYYTGNVKLEGGDYDYINNGREANTVLVTSKNGIDFSEKQELMRNTDYPSNLTCHVRDPKVWKDGSMYYMIQGARTKEDVGQALIFESKDKINWTFKSRIESEEPFGYMWECPDYFEVDDTKILSASVQGLEGKEWVDRNVYQSGYFLVQGNILDNYELSEYHLWDYGFDYYAPQSFETEDGRRIHISWMGMPDCEEYTNKTLKDGWQHCFTFPREVFVKDEKVCQRPIRELEQKSVLIKSAKGYLTEEDTKTFEVNVRGIKDNQFCIKLAEELILDYANGRFQMRFTDTSKDAVSAGRGIRYVNADKVENVKVLADVSSVEVFVNDGEYVFSTRYYPEKYRVEVEAFEASVEIVGISI